MRIYKYRDLSVATPEVLGHIQQLVELGLTWCAAPGTLNDDEEFTWTCDYTVTDDTLDLVAELLMRHKGRPPAVARQMAANVIHQHGIESYANGVISTMTEQCRAEVGLSCFGTTDDNDILWERYGGNGAGLCAELEVPDRLIGSQLHRVTYRDAKVIHIDTFLRSSLGDLASTRLFYLESFLTKTKTKWEAEDEVRFVSKRQSINVKIDESAVTRIILGERLSHSLQNVIARMAPLVPTIGRHV